MTPLNHGVDAVIGAFEHGFDPAIGEVFDPARHPFCPGFTSGTRPESDTLHPTRDVDVDTLGHGDDGGRNPLESGCSPKTSRVESTAITGTTEGSRFLLDR